MCTLGESKLQHISYPGNYTLLASVPDQDSVPCIRLFQLRLWTSELWSRLENQCHVFWAIPCQVLGSTILTIGYDCLFTCLPPGAESFLLGTLPKNCHGLLPVHLKFKPGWLLMFLRLNVEKIELLMMDPSKAHHACAFLIVQRVIGSQQHKVLSPEGLDQCEDWTWCQDHCSIYSYYLCHYRWLYPSNLSVLNFCFFLFHYMLNAYLL